MREAKILVIDDETDAREFVSVALDQWGATVASAKSADEGLKTIDVLHPNVIVCDIGMPDKDGFQFITELRARSADRGGKTPAVALTAYARADDRARALASGFEMHIPKPVDPYELAVVISKLLQSHK